MNTLFVCQSGQRVPWSSVCDGNKQCRDGSDEQNCHCQGDVYACLQGNHVSCKLACATYGRVTCLTYQNLRACEQYMPKYRTRAPASASSTTNSFIYADDLRYSVSWAVGTCLVFCTLSFLVYLIRKQSSRSLFVCAAKPFTLTCGRKPSSRLSAMLQPQAPSSLRSPQSRYIPAPDRHGSLRAYQHSERNSVSPSDCYEPPLYSGSLSAAHVNYSDSIYYETIQTPSLSNSMSMLHPLPLPEPQRLIHLRTHCV